MTRPTRRGLLGGAAVLAAAPLAASAVIASGQHVQASAAQPDRDLIGACEEYLRLQQKFEARLAALPGDIADDDPAWSILDPIDDLKDKIATFQATTAEGHFARARCIAFHHMPYAEACRDFPDDPSEDRFRAANLRDAVRVVRGAGA
jgi:hypothetical protein